MGERYKDITGLRVNKLTAIEFVKIEKPYSRSRAVWKWKCDCGNTIILPASSVLRRSKDCQRYSCGCEFPIHKYTGSKTIANSKYKYSYSDGDLSFDDFYKMSQECCYYYGSPPSNKTTRNGIVLIYNGLDRIDNTLPHNKNNVVPCCWLCNQWKRAMTQEAFLTHVKKIYEQREL